MSFKLGNFHTRNIPGFTAILDAAPSLPVSISLGDLPAGDGSFYYGSRMRSTEWDFNLSLRGSSAYEVIRRADDISRALNPNVYGLQDFTPQAFDPWVWQGVVSSPITWDRDKVLWFGEGICQLNGKMTITTPDPYGKVALPPVTREGPGALRLRDIGNAPYRPRFEITGESTPTRNITISGPGGSTTIRTAMDLNEELVVDFDQLEFYVRNSSTGIKLRNVAEDIVSFHRLELQGDVEVSVSSDLATLHVVRAYVTSRRI